MSPRRAARAALLERAVKARAAVVADAFNRDAARGLQALSAAGLLDSHVVPSVAGPPRRYYRITDTGRATLADWLGAWRNTRDFVNRCTETGSP